MGAWGLERGIYMTFKDNTLLYLVNQCDKADEELQQSVNFFRYHRADEVDLLEIIIKKTRRDTLHEVLKDTMNLLKLR